MRRGKVGMETYIAVVSQNIFETVNPFWAALEKGWTAPSVCRILHVPEYKKEFQSIGRWIREISEEYMDDDIVMESHLFDDENIPGFIDLLKKVIKTEKVRGNKIVVDVTSAEWNYIPASLMLMADENPGLFKSVLYHQFSTSEYSQTPYPLIPLTEQRLYNLLKIDALEDLRL
jgi:hypothetical protein